MKGRGPERDTKRLAKTNVEIFGKAQDRPNRRSRHLEKVKVNVRYWWTPTVNN